LTLVYSFDHQLGLPHDEVKAIIGGKAANIAVMSSDLGLPVPPGFVISTDACRAYLADGWPDGLDEEIREHMARVEEKIGRRFGEAGNPLLVSVRSGAPVSMPGMMDTILNLGLNDSTVAGLASMAGDESFAIECRRRFVDTYRDIVGVEDVPGDPWEQLRGAVEAVFRSWDGERARSYRAYEGIPDDLGTAVTVQTMVFGNLGDDSATGVIFTRNPATGEPILYGDVLFGAQGEDVVAGTHDTEPITALDDRMPEIGAQLRGYADRLEHHYTDVCDIEFTIERGHLWMLQTRVGKRSPQAALRIAIEMAEDDGFPLTRGGAVERVAHLLADPPIVAMDTSGDAAPLTEALGASPGVAGGRIATSADMAVSMAEAGETVLLVRPETSPDDVHGMAKAAGILTATGGLASHAAVVARGWGIPAVVGAVAVEVGERTVTIGGQTFTSEDFLTIDGGTGEVFAGMLVGETQIIPEAATLLDWAGELGIEVAEPGEGSTTGMTDDGMTSAAEGPAPEMVIRALMIKGYVTSDGLAPAVLCSEEAAAVALDDLVAEGMAEPVGAMYQLSETGKAAAGELIVADRDEWGVENANAALDTFLPLDNRMKVIVTAWQMQEVDGKPVMNDHTDAAYDAAVLADFQALAGDADVWMGSLCGGLPRLSAYRQRLSLAARLTGEGDHLYIASPKVDSYHTVWFELHEDLIHLAGRTREDEVAAGRA